MPRLLELFSGTGSIGRAFADLGWDVDSVDILGNPTWRVDIRELDLQSLPHYDVVWASPPCTQYSVARTTAKTPRDLVGSDELVLAALRVIAHCQPMLWWMENPQSGLLKTRPMMQNLPYHDVDYCCYGTLYRKRTRLWTNARSWTGARLCDRQTCPSMLGTRHQSAAQVFENSRAHLYALPRRLCDDIAAYCHAAYLQRHVGAMDGDP